MKEENEMKIIALLREYRERLLDYVEIGKSTANPFLFKVNNEHTRVTFVRNFLRWCTELSETASEILNSNTNSLSAATILELKLRQCEFEIALEQLEYWLRYYKEPGSS